MLVISHPVSFLDALILVAAFERQVRCLVNRTLSRGPWRRLLAWGLGMIPCEAEDVGRQSALEACCDALAKGRAVAVFAELQVTKAGEPPRLAQAAATAALEAESRHSGQLGLTLFPVHIFLPVVRSQSRELLIHVDAPLFPQEYGSRGADLPGRARMLAKALEDAFRHNAFRLPPGGVEQFLSDLEEIFRSDLEEDWTSRPNWKQKVEGFALSQFVAEWVEQLNYLNPGRLVALREFVDAYREARRRWSLRQLEVEQAGTWLKSPWHWLWVGVESAVGLPLAVYGLFNHLLAWLLLFWSGLVKKDAGRSQRVEWLARALVVLGCYAGQTLLGAHWLGRAAAGYYALSLPVSGAYLWRYGGLLRNRTRPLLLAVRVPRQALELRRKRKELLEELNTARDAYAEMLGLAH